MTRNLDVQPRTPSLVILKTLDAPGPLHGFGIARRIEETSKHRITINYGTPALLEPEQERCIAGTGGQTDNNRRARYYALTPTGRKRLERKTRDWHGTADLIAAFLGARREAP